jgi:hypothetical protein
MKRKVKMMIKKESDVDDEKEEGGENNEKEEGNDDEEKENGDEGQENKEIQEEIVLSSQRFSFLPSEQGSYVEPIIEHHFLFFILFY